jgi:hypothetical protein
MAEAHVGNGDFEDARAFAYVYLCDVLHAPHVFICRAMEQACGATAFQLAASPRGAGIMRFNSPEERDEIVAMSPVVYEDNSITIERHEEADNRFYAFYWVYAEVVVMDYPLEHWEEESAREVLATLGNVCCLDQTCFSGGDYTSIRAVLRLDHHCELPEQLLVRNHNGPACLYTVYMVRTWLDAGPEPDWGEYDFGNGPELHTAPRYHPVGNPPTQLSSAPQNLVATILEWENVITSPLPLRPVRTRQATLYPRRQADTPLSVLYLPWYGIGGVPALPPSMVASDVNSDAAADMATVDGDEGGAAAEGATSDTSVAFTTLSILEPNAGEHTEVEHERRGGLGASTRDSARKLRRSLRLKEEEPGFELPEDKVARVQHAKFDFSGASRRLRNILSTSYLTSPEYYASDDTDSLLDIAAACGATEEEAAVISGGATTPPTGA